ncbi:50S ribosomal protein L25/general stress protein Ctc [Demequina activiva]|uniref:Large ribosomal subunit protein bL25 n=1 Tax=Demequina activiva TaxID=1582364 RepID=A0A919Q2G8_9MICO|nr:50S ribosomal protein L25/general stress protein Ctc [Demequina activiva]GIG53661.1 50S ribosomal protein L25 [Demequina activiva]
MSDKLTLAATRRTEFGKGYARRIRANHQIPAVIYGHGEEPQHVILPGHDTMMALKNPNALLTIDIEGEEKQLTVAKDVQRDPIKPVIVHIDLLTVKKGEKITVDVPVHLEGESAPGTIHVLENSSLQILAEATHLPEYLTLSIDGMEEGDKKVAADIELPKGSELAVDPELLVVHVTVPRQAAEEEPAAAEGETASEDATETDEGDDN